LIVLVPRIYSNLENLALWARKGPDPSDWYNTNTEHFAHGPAGPGLSETNSGEINGWDSISAPDGAWSDSEKTVNDPCPTGYRVPTGKEWSDVLANNENVYIGSSWSSGAANYETGLKLGESLFLPAAGYRNYELGGTLRSRGDSGLYWSSSEFGSYEAWHLYFYKGRTNTLNYDRRGGFSVRCIAE
jgi:uncharacterized protein (TIGR02145 family)